MKPQSIYSMLIDFSEDHTKFGRNKGYKDLLKFDLAKKKIWNGKTVIVDDGKVVVDELCGYTDLKSVPLMTEDEASQNLEELYYEYKISTPNKHTGFSQSNFKAIHFDNLMFSQLVNGTPRTKAQYMLEAFVMFSDLTGLFKDTKHFYWQSENEPDLIIFRSWA